MAHPVALFAVSLGLAMSASRVAHAEGSGSNAAAAEALFREAKDLVAKGHEREACGKFRESQRLDPATGTLLAIAQCDEREGRTASAWLKFTTVAAVARSENRLDRLKFAKAGMLRMEAKLRFATLKQERGRELPSNATVTIDGEKVSFAGKDLRIPLDPGPHTVQAAADGYDSAEVSAVIGEMDIDVVLPGLVRTSKPPVLAQAPPTRPVTSAVLTMPVASQKPDFATSSSARRVVSWVGLVSGVCSAGAGFAFGYAAAVNWGEVTDKCTPASCGDRSVQGSYERAQDFATVSTVLIVVGAALAVGGLASLLTASRAPGTPASTALVVRW